MSSGYHTAATVAHELGHAASLADLYNHGETPCLPSHKHNPDNTIMDCTADVNSGQHDIDNLDELYKKRPTQVNNFTAPVAVLNGSVAAIGFLWTDRSFNELYQYIAMDNNVDGVGEGYPLVVPRDAEAAEWGGLQPNTTYCFFIQPVNAYGVLATRSTWACRTTPQVPPPTPTPTPSSGVCPVGGVTELARRLPP